MEKYKNSFKLWFIFLISIVISIIIISPSLAATNRPRLTVTKYTINPDPAAAGKPFQITLNLANVGNRDAKNIDLRLKNIEGKPTLGQFSPIGSSNYFFLDELLEGESYTKKLKIKTSEKIESGTYNLILNVQYQDSGARNYADQIVIGVSVLRVPEIQIKGLTYPTEILPFGKNRDNEDKPKITSGSSGCWETRLIWTRYWWRDRQFRRP